MMSVNTLLIVSWQAPHTLGRRMLEGHDQVKIFGEVHDIIMRVERANGFFSSRRADPIARIC